MEEDYQSGEVRPRKRAGDARETVETIGNPCTRQLGLNICWYESCLAWLGQDTGVIAPNVFSID